MPFGEAALRRKGDDVTVLTIGPSLYPAMDAAAELAGHGIEAEVIDARTSCRSITILFWHRCAAPAG